MLNLQPIENLKQVEINSIDAALTHVENNNGAFAHVLNVKRADGSVKKYEFNKSKLSPNVVRFALGTVSINGIEYLLVKQKFDHANWLMLNLSNGRQHYFERIGSLLKMFDSKSIYDAVVHCKFVVEVANKN